jgi:hypothetical protein
MKTTPIKLAAASLIALLAGVAHAQIAVGGSISINTPGVYGRVDIGPQPGAVYVPPAVVYAQPVIIAPSPIAVHQRPIYLYVPDAYSRDWAHHCRAYNACGQPVYFVRDQWVRERYAQHYPHGHAYGHDRDGRGDRHEDRHEDRHDGKHDHDDGDHGHGDGHGHGRGHD